MSILIEEKLRKKLHDTQQELFEVKSVLEEIRQLAMIDLISLPSNFPEKIDNALGYGEEK